MILLSVIPMQFAAGIYWNHYFIKKLSNDIKSIKEGVEANKKVVGGDNTLDPLLTLAKKLDLFYVNGIGAAVFNFITNTAMTCWVFLLRKAAYHVPFGWGSAGLAGLYAIYVVCHPEDYEFRSRSKRTKTRTTSKESLSASDSPKPNSMESPGGLIGASNSELRTGPGSTSEIDKEASISI
mmetsp:Transcript_5466/g.6917  ORF Transcript_5466/g.6917 Transcript_5466/m.6917 type:complete len:181 (+) Transcript_5466:325-867(+)